MLNRIFLIILIFLTKSLLHYFGPCYVIVALSFRFKGNKNTLFLSVAENGDQKRIMLN